jgi:serine/threonine protein kinase
MDFAKQILSGILAIHSKGIVHRDIKNRNIYISSTGEYKIGDFSECRHLGNSQYFNLFHFSLLGINKSTKATFYFGTPQTTPPEIIRKGKYDHRADLWSIGVVLYQVANLELPFKEENVNKLYKAILNKDPRPLKNEFLSGSLKSLISRLLTKDRKQRISL